MLKISLVQPNFQQGPKEFNAYYLPYTVGILWAYANQFPIVRENYKLDHIVWKRDDVDHVAEKLSTSNVVAFSTYVWNKNYNYALAKRLKKLNPNVITIFGGPEIPITKSNLFKKLPFADIVVKLEGEYIFKDVLESIILNYDFKSIPGLLINDKGNVYDTGSSKRIEFLDTLPSPYLTGVFDKLIEEVKDVEWNVTIETNRGCPYACTFCDWGSLTYNKIKKFNLDRVFAELEWAGKNKCGFVTVTDANFGIFVDRDNAIADKLIEVQNTYGYPASFSMTWAKDQKPEVFDIIFKLIKNPKFNQGLTVSVQSMDLDVLENIKRRNLAQHKIDKIFEMCDKHNVPVYTEIILGLPGETKETWKESFYKIFRAGNHTGINILQAQLLENAEMNLEQREQFKMTSVPVYDYMSGSYNTNELKESVEVVTSTKDLPFEDMLDSQIHGWFLQTFHINGFTTFLSRFLYKNNSIDYKEFYEKLWNFLQDDPWFNEQHTQVRKYYQNWMTSGQINHPNISNIEVHGWNIVHRTTLLLHAENQYDHVFDLIEKFAMSTFDLDKKLLAQILKFQKNYVINYSTINKFPYDIKFDYDFLGFLQEDKILNQSAEYRFDFAEDKTMSLDRFLENIYFYRKRNFGKALITRV